MKIDKNNYCLLSLLSQMWNPKIYWLCWVVWAISWCLQCWAYLWLMTGKWKDISRLQWSGTGLTFLTRICWFCRLPLRWIWSRDPSCLLWSLNYRIWYSVLFHAILVLNLSVYYRFNQYFHLFYLFSHLLFLYFSLIWKLENLSIV